MQCSKETLARLFYSSSSFFFLLFLFLYLSITFLLKFLHFIGSYPLIQSKQNDFGNIFSEDEEEESIKFNNKHLLHTSYDSLQELQETHHSIIEEEEEEVEEEEDNESFYSSDMFMSAYDYDPAPILESVQHDGDGNGNDGEVDDVEEIPKRYGDDHGSLDNFVPIIDHNQKSILVHGDKKLKDDDDSRFVDGKFLVSKKLKVIEKYDEEIFGDSCTNGSTSKSSSDWRSSINCRDSGTEDPFSSSSRRSCPKWESYTIFQKYDEEMTFLDRISAQKLHESDSLKSIKVCPRSISERIIHKLATTKQKKSSDIHRNPYHELEAAYVAQICLTWEALNWNYIHFHHKIAARKHDFDDPGSPADVAQEFQQFQVLLQRYIENEPYEQGKRPEVYARMRLLAPKLLLVPEYQDSEEDDDKKDGGFGSRISTPSFLMIMEDGIRTFMNFLKADKEKPCRILRAFFTKNRKGLVDPTLLNLMKKVNTKKKVKLNDLRKRKCMRKRRLSVDQEMEVSMGLIDLKVVSRVLRMSDINEEQLHWCEDKMSKVRVSDGKLQRDPSTIFFPSH